MIPLESIPVKCFQLGILHLGPAAAERGAVEAAVLLARGHRSRACASPRALQSFVLPNGIDNLRGKQHGAAGEPNLRTPFVQCHLKGCFVRLMFSGNLVLISSHCFRKSFLGLL